MIRRKESFSVKVNEKTRGGEGSVIFRQMLDKEDLYDKGRLYAHLTLKPGCSIGYHIHEGEMETFYVLKGTAVFNDNGTETELHAGDVAYTADGCGHSVANNGAEDLELLALIINH